MSASSAYAARDQQRGQWAACARMHEALCLWGSVLLHGVTGAELGEDQDPDPTPKTKPEWTMQQQEAAWAVDRRVNALEPQPRFVLRVFYGTNWAEDWDDYEPAKRVEFEEKLCRRINVRWRRYCADAGELPRTVRTYQLRAILDAAIRELCDTA